MHEHKFQIGDWVDHTYGGCVFTLQIVGISDNLIALSTQHERLLYGGIPSFNEMKQFNLDPIYSNKQIWRVDRTNIKFVYRLKNNKHTICKKCIK